MAMLLTKSEAKDFKPAPEGTHSGVCVQIIDMGIQETNFGPKRQVRLAFEIDELMENGEPFLIAANLTAVMNEKSNLYKLLCGWFGRSAIESALANGGLDMKRFLGKPAMVNVSHSKSADGTRTYANIASLSGLPKGMAPLQPKGKLVYFDADAPDMAALEGLPEWLGDKIGTGLGRVQDQRKPVSNGGADGLPGAADLDLGGDEIPF